MCRLNIVSTHGFSRVSMMRVREKQSQLVRVCGAQITIRSGKFRVELDGLQEAAQLPATALER
jgi:hypothetical protein